MAEVPVAPNATMEELLRLAIEYLNYTDGFVIQHKYNNAGESARKYIILPPVAVIHPALTRELPHGG